MPVIERTLEVMNRGTLLTSVRWVDLLRVSSACC